LLLLLTGVADVQAEAPVPIPDALSPWVDWVLEDDDQRECPIGALGDAQRICAWPGPLRLELDAKGGRFEQPWTLSARDWLPLPGGSGQWPQQVSATQQVDADQQADADQQTAPDRRPLPVVERAGRPMVHVEAGRVLIQGRFSWPQPPDVLRLPTETGLFRLSLNGAEVDRPRLDAEGGLWLGAERPAPERQEPDALSLEVMRRIEDSLPLRVQTRILLEVSGQPRQLQLGPVLLPNGIPLRLESPLPARLIEWRSGSASAASSASLGGQPSYLLQVQLRPGRWELTLESQHPAPVAALSWPEHGMPIAPATQTATQTATKTATSAGSEAASASSAGQATAAAQALDAPTWPKQEVWVFAARPDLRQVELSGAEPIDPRQTRLPPAWQSLPAYLLRPGQQLQLSQISRGASALDQLQLARILRLDFDGAGLSLRDRLSGELQGRWRLDAEPPLELGQVSVNGEPRLITRLAGDEQRTGVEVRGGRLDLTADARIDTGPVGWRLEVPASGWDAPLTASSLQLDLPPGWDLLAVSGVDNLPDSWLARWSLLDLFLVLIAALAVARLWGWHWGLVALLTLLLTWQEPGAPRWAWLNLIAAAALVRLVPLRLVRGSTLTPQAQQSTADQAAGADSKMTAGATAESTAGRASDPTADLIAESAAGLSAGVSAEATADGSARTPTTGAAAGTLAAAAEPGWLATLLQLYARIALLLLVLIAIPFLITAVRDGLFPQLEQQGSGLLGLGVAVNPALTASADLAPRPTPASSPLAQSELAPALAESVNAARMKSGSAPPPAASKPLPTLDPDAQLQTGAGVPDWTWRRFELSWSGPVPAEHRFQLWLLPAEAGLPLALLSLLLVPLLALRLADLLPSRRARVSAASLLLVGFGLISLSGLLPTPAIAESQSSASTNPLAFPPQPLLDQLRERLLQPPDCLPRCAEIAHLLIDASPSELRLLLAVDAAVPVALPIPGARSGWSPSQISVDGEPLDRLLSLADGSLAVPVPSGRHLLLLSAPLVGVAQVELPLPLRPRLVKADLGEAWTLEGVGPNGMPGEQLRLKRSAVAADAPLNAVQRRSEGLSEGLGDQAMKAGTRLGDRAVGVDRRDLAAAGDRPDQAEVDQAAQPGVNTDDQAEVALPPLLKITRTLRFGLDWEVRTEVERRSPLGQPVTLRVPLISGESVTTEGVQVNQNGMLVSLPPERARWRWSSVLRPVDQLELRAATDPRLSE
jgi:hypothetical protein